MTCRTTIEVGSLLGTEAVGCVERINKWVNIWVRWALCSGQRLYRWEVGQTEALRRGLNVGGLVGG